MLGKSFDYLFSIASRLGKQQKLIILIYHRILDNPDYMYPYEPDIIKFKWQMELLASHFKVLPLAEALDRLYAGSLPSKAVCITFDDGYADNYQHAFPILLENGLPATFFVVSGMLNTDRMWNDDVVETVRHYPEPVMDLEFLGMGRHNLANPREKYNAAIALIKAIKYLPLRKRDEICRTIALLAADLPKRLMLTAEQVKHLSEQGMEIGSHSVNHPILKDLPIADWQAEILNSKLKLESVTGRAVRFFAYPNGKLNTDYTIDQTNFIKQCGYSAGFSTDSGCATAKANCLTLPRFTPWDVTPNRFLLRMAGMSVLGGV